MHIRIILLYLHHQYVQDKPLWKYVFREPQPTNRITTINPIGSPPTLIRLMRSIPCNQDPSSNYHWLTCFEADTRIIILHTTQQQQPLAHFYRAMRPIIIITVSDWGIPRTRHVPHSVRAGLMGLSHLIARHQRGHNNNLPLVNWLATDWRTSYFGYFSDRWPQPPSNH